MAFVTSIPQSHFSLPQSVVYLQSYHFGGGPFQPGSDISRLAKNMVYSVHFAGGGVTSWFDNTPADVSAK